MVRFNWSQYLLLAVGIIAILFFACWFLQQFTAQHDRSLLTETPFTASGWHGIVPGQSTREEAWRILKHSPYVRRASIWMTEIEDPSTTINELIYWDDKSLDLLPCDGVVCNRMIIASDKVLLIEIFLGYEVRAAQVVERYGAPQQIIRCHQVDRSGTPYTAIYLWYGTEGLALQSRGAYSVYEGLLIPESYVTDIYYFEPMELAQFIDQLGHDIYLCQDPQIEGWSGYDPAPTP